MGNKPSNYNPLQANNFISHSQQDISSMLKSQGWSYNPQRKINNEAQSNKLQNLEAVVSPLALILASKADHDSQTRSNNTTYEDSSRVNYAIPRSQKSSNMKSDQSVVDRVKEKMNYPNNNVPIETMENTSAMFASTQSIQLARHQTSNTFNKIKDKQLTYLQKYPRVTPFHVTPNQTTPNRTTPNQTIPNRTTSQNIFNQPIVHNWSKVSSQKSQQSLNGSQCPSLIHSQCNSLKTTSKYGQSLHNSICLSQSIINGPQLQDGTLNYQINHLNMKYNSEMGQSQIAPSRIINNKQDGIMRNSIPSVVVHRPPRSQTERLYNLTDNDNWQSNSSVVNIAYSNINMATSNINPAFSNANSIKLPQGSTSIIDIQHDSKLPFRRSKYGNDNTVKVTFQSNGFKGSSATIKPQLLIQPNILLFVQQREHHLALTAHLKVTNLSQKQQMIKLKSNNSRNYSIYPKGQTCLVKNQSVTIEIIMKNWRDFRSDEEFCVYSKRWEKWVQEKRIGVEMKKHKSDKPRILDPDQIAKTVSLEFLQLFSASKLSQTDSPNKKSQQLNSNNRNNGQNNSFDQTSSKVNQSMTFPAGIQLNQIREESANSSALTHSLNEQTAKGFSFGNSNNSFLNILKDFKPSIGSNNHKNPLLNSSTNGQQLLVNDSWLTIRNSSNTSLSIDPLDDHRLKDTNKPVVSQSLASLQAKLPIFDRFKHPSIESALQISGPITPHQKSSSSTKSHNNNHPLDGNNSSGHKSKLSNLQSRFYELRLVLWVAIFWVGYLMGGGVGAQLLSKLM